MKPGFDVFMGCSSPDGKARIVLIGAPFDSAAGCRPGARFGPAAIRRGSFHLETFSPYQGRDLSGCPVSDRGDLELSPGSAQDALVRIGKSVSAALDDGKLPLILGGEHLVTLGAVRALHEKYPRLQLIQFDAHGSLRADCLGVSLSSLCVMRRCYELLGEQKIHQFCIRSGTRKEFEFAQAHTDMHLFNFGWLDPLISRLEQRNTPVYLTIDLDCLDPSVLPGTVTPEPGGVRFPELLEAVMKVCAANVVGVDITGLAPMLDPSGISTAAACKLVREILIALSKKPGREIF